ncbi:GNAT family N-acetyltransferase [Phycicoccus sp. MQZ13P-5]|uniref:GNAT family N-acetyltransferase n=2 Tax=Phycicoccus sonneratiae TaxID=2807628 RepID=A0ABS2CIR6_9MICO|nr:GNAT family N-acetyltransferase [Phycicoccus sonneraticus]
MAGVLADPLLYTVIGGEPPTVGELRARYAGQLRGPVDPDEEWHTWVVRDGDDGPLVGFVQATLTRGGSTAELAWVVGVPWQGRGLAGRAAALVLAHLRGRAVREVHAYVRPGHRASERVAERLGMVRTAVQVDGETRWRLVLRP